MIANKDLKRRIIEISYKLKLGHIGSCLTAVDIIEEIYKIKKPDEKFVLSAGHAHLAHLVVMEKYGLLPEVLSSAITNLEGILKWTGIHCDRQAGCDASTGSLGHGIGIAVGMALSDRFKNVYCLLSDGELAEGSVYEALQIAERQVLNHNLHVYINNNGWGAYRQTIVEGDFLLEGIRQGSFIDVQERKTNLNEYPAWLQGQIAHYKVLDKKEYEELMEILK